MHSIFHPIHHPQPRRFTRMPDLLSCCAIQALLVSITCPISSSSPMVMMLVLTMRLIWLILMQDITNREKSIAVYLLLTSCVCSARILNKSFLQRSACLKRINSSPHAVISMYVVEIKTGRLLYEKCRNRAGTRPVAKGDYKALQLFNIGKRFSI